MKNEIFVLKEILKIFKTEQWKLILFIYDDLFLLIVWG
jgi:hypothetical protein